MAVSYVSTYDPTTSIGEVRFTIEDWDVVTSPPEDPSVTPRDQWSCLFTDQEIQLKLNKYGDKVNAADLAAAELLEDVANSSALIARLITLGDYTSDTRSTASGLRSQAQWLRNRWAAAQSSGSDEPAEYITEEPWDDLSYGRIILERG